MQFIVFPTGVVYAYNYAVCWDCRGKLARGGCSGAWCWMTEWVLERQSAVVVQVGAQPGGRSLTYLQAGPAVIICAD